MAGETGVEQRGAGLPLLKLNTRNCSYAKTNPANGDLEFTSPAMLPTIAPAMHDPKQPDEPSSNRFLVYRSEDGQTKVEVRLENETVWLTQQHMAELFQTTKQNISLHLQNIFDDRELVRGVTVKESLTVQQEFNRKRIQESDQAGGEFEKAIKQLPSPAKPKKKGGRK